MTTRLVEVAAVFAICLILLLALPVLGLAQGPEALTSEPAPSAPLVTIYPGSGLTVTCPGGRILPQQDFIGTIKLVCVPTQLPGGGK